MSSVIQASRSELQPLVSSFFLFLSLFSDTITAASIVTKYSQSDGWVSFSSFWNGLTLYSSFLSYLHCGRVFSARVFLYLSVTTISASKNRDNGPKVSPAEPRSAAISHVKTTQRCLGGHQWPDFERVVAPEPASN